MEIPINKVTAEKFFNVWVETVEPIKEDLLKIWHQRGAFTTAVLDKNNGSSIINKISNKLELKCYPGEYYHHDAVLYKEEDLVPKTTNWLRNIRVAFEHENDFNNGLYEEVSHLLITNCDLKVLVTYSDEDVEEQLEYLHKVIIGNRHAKAISEEESFLMIIGREIGFRWGGYVYKENNLVNRYNS